MQSLDELGIDKHKMRAQGYDGAANKSGKHRGVQARIRAEVPLATYVHCKAHNLNLANVHACKQPLVRNIMDTVQQISFCFNFSGKRMVAFRKELAARDDQVKEDMGRRAKLQNLCDTRWASRSDALYTFLSAYPVVVDSLEQLEIQDDAKARSFTSSITRFDFIITLIVCQNILQLLHPLSIMMQTKTFDLVESVSEAKAVMQQVQNKRTDDTVWDEFFDKAVELARKVDTTPSVPRGAGRHQHRNNVPAETTSSYWKRALYFPFLDHLLQELQDRLVGNEERFLAEFLIPSKLQGLTDESVNRVFAIYGDDLDTGDRELFKAEVGRWKARWSIHDDRKPTTLAETLASANKIS